MLKKILIVGAFALAITTMSQSASAQHCHHGGGYGGYRAPVISYHSSYYGHRHGGHRAYRAPAYRASYRSPYRSYYGGGYGYGRRYGGYGYGGYGRGTSIGIGRGGVSLNFGF